MNEEDDLTPLEPRRSGSTPAPPPPPSSNQDVDAPRVPMEVDTAETEYASGQDVSSSVAASEESP
eukprot:9887239-Prorocentrum_lima.AAC.1